MYKLEKFDKTPILETHSRNQLKKFVKYKGFYKQISQLEEKEKEQKKQEDLALVDQTL